MMRTIRMTRPMSPTTVNTPATAALFWKKLDDEKKKSEGQIKNRTEKWSVSGWRRMTKGIRTHYWYYSC